MGTVTISNGRLGNFSPKADGVVMWLDVSDFSTVKNNIDFSTNKTSQINDKSGNGYDLSQGTPANQATYSATSFNGGPGLSLVAGISMQRNMAGTFISEPSLVAGFTMILVFNPTLGGSRVFLTSGYNQTGFRVKSSSNQARVDMASDDASAATGNGQFSSGVNTVLTLTWDNSTMEIYNNGVLKQSTATSPQTVTDVNTTFELGRISLGGTFVFQQIMFFPSKLTTAQRLRNEAYANMRAGL